MSVRRRASGRVHYNYFRDYDPAVAKYAEPDPLGLKAGINLFAYVSNSPGMYVDPKGLEAVYQGCAGAWGVTLCDGNNGFEIRNCGKGCVRLCVQIHEQQHVDDYRRAGRCQNRKRGTSPTTEADFSGDNFFFRSECKAYRAGKRCAEKQKTKECCKPDFESLDAFIKTSDHYLRYFKCDLLMGW